MSKTPPEEGTLCIVNHETFHFFAKKCGDLCHIINKDTGLYDVTDIDESVQGSSGNMFATKKGKLHVKLHQVNGSKRLHALEPMKFCTKAGVNLYLLTCKLFQGNKIFSDFKSNIVIQSTSDDSIFNCWIKTHDGWVARVEFLHETDPDST